LICLNRITLVKKKSFFFFSKRKEKKRKEKNGYNWLTLGGVEESQITELEP